MVKTVKLLNTLQRTFNGVRPWKTVNVDEGSVSGYLANGFIEAKEQIANDFQKADEAKKEVKLTRAQQKKADEDAKKQAKAQAKLDAEYQEKNGKKPETETEEEEGEDLDDGEETETEEETVDDVSDIDALGEDLDKAPAPKKK